MRGLSGNLEGRHDVTDIFGRAERWIGDAAAKARERERMRIEDRLRLIDGIAENARTVVRLGKHRPGYGWQIEMEDARLEMVARAHGVGDAELLRCVDELAAIEVPFEGAKPTERLEMSYRAIVARSAVVRRETFSDDLGKE